MTGLAAHIAEPKIFACADGGRLRYSTAGAGEPVRADARH